MNETAAELLLTEFRDFRREINEWKQDTTERIVRLETLVKPALLGNGQPAQIVNLDTRVTRLEKAWGKVVAVAAVVWTAITLAARYAPLWTRH